MKQKASDRISVLVVDDHPIVREGIAAMIGQQPDLRVVGITGTLEETVETWRRLRPDVVLLDLQLGKVSGLQVLELMRSEDAFAKVVMLTTYDLEEDIFRTLRAGAAGYLLKESSRHELMEAIRRVAHGEKVLPPSVAAKLANRLMGIAPTERELEVVVLLREGLANKEIASRLSITEGTAKTHVMNIMQKLDAASRTEAVKRAIEKGWLR